MADDRIQPVDLNKLPRSLQEFSRASSKNGAGAEQQVLRRGQTQAAPQDDAVFETRPSNANEAGGVCVPLASSSDNPVPPGADPMLLSSTGGTRAGERRSFAGTVRYQSGGRFYNIPKHMEILFLRDRKDARRAE